MWAKVVVTVGAILFVLFAFFYFSTNSSYSLASEAKAFYDLGKYDEAIELAEIAYKKDNYNRMAFTVITQSKEHKKWLKFIKESKEFLQKATDISNQRVITRGDRYEMKIMAELVMEEYLKLAKEDPLIKEDVREKADHLHKQFKKIYYELIK